MLPQTPRATEPPARLCACATASWALLLGSQDGLGVLDQGAADVGEHQVPAGRRHHRAADGPFEGGDLLRDGAGGVAEVFGRRGQGALAGELPQGDQVVEVVAHDIAMLKDRRHKPSLLLMTTVGHRGEHGVHCAHCCCASAAPSDLDLEHAEQARKALEACGAQLPDGDDAIVTPLTGRVLARVSRPDAAEVEAAIGRAAVAFQTWRTTPAPVRGLLVKRLTRLLETHKEDLATLITLEVGKIGSEALGEVQEMIDVCDYAIGLSRSVEGRTLPSERPGHRLMETWHPRGVVAVISAFNFPAAVWSWNTAIALVCGDPVIWKPSETTPLTSLACTALLDRAIADSGAPADLHQLLLADRDAAAALLDDPRVALVSATGSERMGREIAPRVAARFGETLLELGGNNAAIVTPSADLDLTVRGIVFSAAGTAGQRCTTMRRVIVHSSIADALVERLVAVYGTLRIGDPNDDGTLVGPLINQAAHDRMQARDRPGAGRGRHPGRRRRPAGLGARRLLRAARRSCGCPPRPRSCGRRPSRRCST